jgi:beta-1,4-N-acetylglucosaminyltransferase
MLVFVTVGSTRFDALVEAAISESVLSTLRDSGYGRLILQCGNSIIESEEFNGKNCIIQRHGVDIEIWRFKPSIQAECGQADLVVSHAGELSVLLEQAVT